MQSKLNTLEHKPKWISHLSMRIRHVITKASNGKCKERVGMPSSEIYNYTNIAIAIAIVPVINCIQSLN